jgi:hypothetical protein
MRAARPDHAHLTCRKDAGQIFVDGDEVDEITEDDCSA